MLAFETVSISLNLLMLAVVGVATGRLPLRIPRWLVKGALWLMTALFLLNTVGNLGAATALEKMLFTPITLLPAIFSFRLAIDREEMSAPGTGRSA